MYFTSERSISMAAAGAFRTPGQLAGDVSKRDREWGDWERDGIQSVVNQLNDILLKNYPGQGWMRIRLKAETYSSHQHAYAVFTAFQSAFGDKVKGLRAAVCAVFPGTQWRAVSSFDGHRMVFNFQPLDVPMRWYERWFGWISAVAEMDEDLDCSKIAAPPTSLRPNARGTDNSSTDGITVGSGKDSKAAQAFAYENLC
jgi:hypothetical protein